MLTCKQVSQLVSQSLDRPLSWSDRIQLKLHLIICGACYRFRKQLNLLQHSMQVLVQKTENDSTIKLNLEAKNRIMQSMRDSEQ